MAQQQLLEPPTTDDIEPARQYSLSASWRRATTLRERIASLRCAGKVSALQDLDHGRAQRRREQWLAQAVFANDDSLFARRLVDDNVTDEEFLLLLGESDRAAPQRMGTAPHWLNTLLQAYSSPAQGDVLAPVLEKADERPERQFVYLIEPLVEEGCERFRQTAGQLLRDYPSAPFDVATMQREFLSSWVQELTRLLTRTLVLELNIARIEDRLRSDSPEERFQSFVELIRNRNTALELLAEYPVLARQLVLHVDRLVHCGLEFLEHLCRDWDRLLETLAPGHDPGRIVKLEGHVGDKHRGGRSVVIATFQSGWKVVYKPRSMSIDIHFQQLLSWLNDRGDHPPLRTLKIVDSGDHGWVEFVEAGGCRTHDEVSRFYQRQGACLALLYAIGATDFHFENLLAAGEHPVLLDLEALFHPPRPKQNQRDIENLVLESTLSSVLSVGLLPHRLHFKGDSEGIDISGMGATENQLSPDALPYWDQIGTDQMRMARRRMPIAGGAHRPTLGGQAVRPLDFADAVVAGFDSVYRLLLNHREEFLSEAGPLAPFQRDDVRVILRHTRTYGLLLSEGFHPDVLRDGLDRDRLFDFLWKDVKRDPRLAHVIAAERQDLHNGDIPFFTTRPGSPDLWTSTGQRIESFFDESGVASLQGRLRHLSRSDLSRQTWLIRASLATTASPGERAPAAIYAVNDQSGAVDPEQLIAAAADIGDRLEALAVRNDEEAIWSGLTLVDQRNWSLISSGLDLYAGLPGIALFLAFLGKSTGCERYEALSRAAVNTLLRYIDKTGLQATALGAFTGWGGVIYALTHLGVIWNRADLLDRAREIGGHVPEFIERDESFDVIAGAAGCIASLANLHAIEASDRILHAAAGCGDWLLDRAVPANDGLGWIVQGAGESPLTGFSHGAAGIAWSLAKLASLTGDARYRSAAADAIHFERSLFSTEQQNWLDRRVEPTAEPSAQPVPVKFMTAWCNGAPGIGLSRLELLSHLDDQPCRGEIDTAIRTTLATGFGDSHSLCHGDLGNIELLLQASRVLEDEQLGQQVRRLTAGILDSAEDHGWLCGVPMHVETPGLMTGLSGIGLGLLRLAAPDAIPSVLTLQGPVAR